MTKGSGRQSARAVVVSLYPYLQVGGTRNGTPPPTQPNLMFSKQFHKLGTKFSIFDPMGPFNPSPQEQKHSLSCVCSCCTCTLSPQCPGTAFVFVLFSLFSIQSNGFHYGMFLYSLLSLVILPHYSPPPIYPHPTVAFLPCNNLSGFISNIFSYSFSIFRPVFFSLMVHFILSWPIHIHVHR